jgi:hypothetical protein
MYLFQKLVRQITALFLMRIEIDKVISKNSSNQGVDLVILLK